LHPLKVEQKVEHKQQKSAAQVRFT